MSDLLSLHGFNKSDGTEKLIAVWVQAPMIYNSATGSWEKAPITLTANQNAEFRTFLDYAFMVNGVDSNYSYDGSVWSTVTNLSDSPKGYFIESYNVRLYLLDVTIAGTRYRSRVCFSDLPKNDAITWGLETSTDLVQTASSAVVTSASSLFQTRNIKVGDPFTIKTGTNAGEYVVESIDSETQITLTKNLTNSTTGSTFWVGGNYFDINTDDGDFGKGFGKNSSELLIFKRNSVHRFNSSGNSLHQIKGAPGTTASRSIVNLGDNTYYYHPTGFYLTNGISSKLISNAIEDIIESITTANQSLVVGWVENEKILNWYIGSITTREGETISNCVCSFDTITQTWGLRDYGINIKAATVWLQSNIPSVYVGDDASHVNQLDSSYGFNGSPIPFALEDGVVFPAGADTLVNFDRIRLCIDNGLDVQVLFKLFYKPTSNSKRWINDNDWRPMKGSSIGEKVEFDFPEEDRRACGVKFRFIESSTNESLFIEKYTIYFSNPAIR